MTLLIRPHLQRYGVGGPADNIPVDAPQGERSYQVRPILEDARFTLHHVRRRLPAEVRVVTPGHALTGQALRARHVYRRYGQRWLVLELPRGGVVSVEVEDTDLLDTEPGVTAHSGVTTLSSEGARRLLGLLEVCTERTALDAGAVRRAGGEDHDA